MDCIHLICILVIVLSLFSTAVMSYIAMATPVGPWIAPTLVLIAMLFCRLVHYKQQISQVVILVAVAGSVGGIIATALGFSLPTLYFVDQQLFNSWMACPRYFSVLVAAMAFFGGWFGLWVANRVENTILVQQAQPFPIAQLIYKMVVASDQVKKTGELAVGFCFTLLFSLLQDGAFGYTGVISKSVALIWPMRGFYVSMPLISFDLWPLLWAIGFVTGQMIAIPLLVAIILKIVLLDPIHIICFSAYTSTEFILAFCSGMVLVSALSGIMQVPRLLYAGIQNLQGKDSMQYNAVEGVFASRSTVIETSLLFVGLFCLFFYFHFSVQRF